MEEEVVPYQLTKEAKVLDVQVKEVMVRPFSCIIFSHFFTFIVNGSILGERSPVHTPL